MQELIKDFNLFEALYRAQQDLAAAVAGLQPARAVEPRRPIGLEGTRGHAKSRWPMLSTSCRASCATMPRPRKSFSPRRRKAGAIWPIKSAERRLEPLAAAGDGPDARRAAATSLSELADRLRSEMEKMFSECQGGNCPPSNELDALFEIAAHEPGQQFRADVAQPEIRLRPGTRPGRRPGRGRDGHIRLRHDGRLDREGAGQ